MCIDNKAHRADTQLWHVCDDQSGITCGYLKRAYA
jgi:hypothetical protein